MSDRERLADLLNYNPSARDLALKMADTLLAAGVSLPPAPEPVEWVDEKTLDSFSDSTLYALGVPNRYTLTLAKANALVLAAIAKHGLRTPEQVAGLVRVADAAQALYDNRLGWSDGRNPYAPPRFWDDLAAALRSRGPA